MLTGSGSARLKKPPGSQPGFRDSCTAFNAFDDHRLSMGNDPDALFVA
jgi:hypothetical protein